MRNSYNAIYLLFASLCFSIGTITAQNACEECEDVKSDGCFYCDVTDLEGETYTLLYPIGQYLGPLPCNEIGSIENPNWFGFVAASEDITITIEINFCGLGGNTSVGPQITADLIDGCEGECLDNGRNWYSITLNSNELIPGNEYFILIDGLSGSVCNYTFTAIDHDGSFDLDDLDAISAVSDCGSCDDGCSVGPECGNDDYIVVCPGATVEFTALHAGNSVTDYGPYDDECSIYPPDLNAIFYWTFDGDDYEFYPLEDDQTGPTITMPIFDESGDEGTYHEICLVAIETECVTLEPDYCVTVYVERENPETYNYNICIEDLLYGATIPTSDDPNNDGVEWQGPSTIYLDDVLEWDDGCQIFENFTECGCQIFQELCINVLGEEDKSEHTFYMYDCQFDESGEYEWVWEEQREEVFLSSGIPECIIIEEGSLQIDLEEEACDTSMVITVESTTVSGELLCSVTSNSAAYTFELDLESLNSGYLKNWPEIDDDYTINFIDCDSGDIRFSTNSKDPDAYVVDSNETVCIQTIFSFYNSAWGDPEDSPFAEVTSCDKIFGPYLLNPNCAANSSLAICPQWQSGLSPLLEGSELTNPEGYIFSKNDYLQISVRENLLPDQGSIVWYASENSNFTPGPQGTEVGRSTISSNWKQGDVDPIILAINHGDLLTGSEYLIVNSGSGLQLSDMFIDLDQDCNDPLCDPDCIDGNYGDVCPWVKDLHPVLSDCDNIIPVGPDDFLPPNSTLVIFMDKNADMIRSAENLCSLDGCIYVLFNECERCMDAFADSGSADYTIYGLTYSNTLSYNITDPETPGHVTYQGEQAYLPDALPEVPVEQVEIRSTVTSSMINLDCDELEEGEIYIKGIIESELFNTNCCSPYTPSLRLTLGCPDPSSELSWTNLGLSQLPTDLTISSCELPYSFPNGQFSDDNNNYPYPLNAQAYSTDCNGGAEFNSTHTPQSTFQEGTTSIQYTVADLCGNTISHSFQVTIECLDTPPPPTDDLINTYPWLTELIDTDNCEGVTVTTYQNGSYIYLIVSTPGEFPIMYNAAGLRYCQDRVGYSCIDAYSLTGPIDSWDCDTVTPPPPPPNSELFNDHPWLSELVDTEDCEGLTISTYQNGSYLYLIISRPGEFSIMYNAAGLRYCQDRASYSCIEAYNLEGPIDTWECGTITPPPPPVDNQLLNDYPWLIEIIDIENCEGVTVSTYQNGSFIYLIVSHPGEYAIMYNANGLRYCQDRAGYSCIEVYNLTGPITTWECGSITPPPPNGSIFDDRSWLSDTVDQNDCEGVSITEYEKGSYIYIYIKTEGEYGVLYNGAGLKYCTSRPTLDCLEFYGLSSDEITDSWSCSDGIIIDPDLQARSIKPVKKSIIYPNPSNGTIHLTNCDKSTELEICDLNGHKVEFSAEHQADNQLLINISVSRGGLFLIRSMTKGRSEIHKVFIMN